MAWYKFHVMIGALSSRPAVPTIATVVICFLWLEFGLIVGAKEGRGGEVAMEVGVEASVSVAGSVSE